MAEFVRPIFGIGIAMSLGACAPQNAAKPYPAAEPPAGSTQASTSTAAAPQVPSTAPAIAKYFDREIDLAPFLAGFPYGEFEPSLRTGKLFYQDQREAYTLMMLDVPERGPVDLGKGKAVTNVDWSKRSLWGVHHRPAGNELWLHADAANDEVMNLWRLDLGSGELTQVTEHDYVYGFGFSQDDERIAYLPRTGKKAPFRTCLRIREVASGSEREVVCDDGKLKFTWSSPRFSPDGNTVYFDALVQDDRKRAHVVAVDLTAKQPKVVAITSNAPRHAPNILEGWVGDSLLFTANDDGFDNLYAFDRKTKKVRQLTRFKEDFDSAEVVGSLVVGVHQTPAGSTLALVDPVAGTVLDERKLPGSTSVLDGHDGRAWIRHESPDIVFEAFDVRTDDRKLAVEQAILVDPGLEDRLVACKASAVRIPTFDRDPATGKTRELHAFLLEPETPLPDAAQRLAFITAFYGGENGYHELDQVLCAAGFVVVSPAVRGSSGFGKTFYSLNDGDLGGDEIIDLFYVARWIERRTGLPPERIGVYGGSHGGYATMRALTFPKQTNGRNESYPFGFGLAHAGFSSIATFYEATNIPDWVLLESGDPRKAKDLARMTDRSPLQHVDKLRAPLLLTHGSKDWRVPVSESRQFATAAKKVGAPVTYVEIEGQGHHIEGLDLQVQAYQVRFDFLMGVAKAAPASKNE